MGKVNGGVRLDNGKMECGERWNSGNRWDNA